MRIAQGEILHRARRLAEDDVDGLAAFREATGEPIPTLLVVVDRLDEGDRSRIATIGGLGRRLGVNAISIGSDPGFEGRIEVDDEGKADGETASAPGIPADLTPHKLTEEDGRTILNTLAAATNLEEELAARRIPAAQPPAKRPGGVLGTVIRVADRLAGRGTAAQDRHLQGIHHKLGAMWSAIDHPIARRLIGIEHHRDVDLALLGRVLGDVADPKSVRLVDLELPLHQVGVGSPEGIAPVQPLRLRWHAPARPARRIRRATRLRPNRIRRPSRSSMCTWGAP